MSVSPTRTPGNLALKGADRYVLEANAQLVAGMELQREVTHAADLVFDMGVVI
jgi:hypothetical protein